MSEIQKKMETLGSKVDVKIEETAKKYKVPKWVVWAGGAIAIVVISKLIL